MDPSLVLPDVLTPEEEQDLEEMQVYLNHDWEGIGPVSNLYQNDSTTLPPSVFSVVNVNDQNALITPPASVCPIANLNSQNGSNTTSTSVSPMKSSEQNSPDTLATSLALDSDSPRVSNTVFPMTTVTPPEAVKVFTFPINDSRAQPEKQPSEQNAKWAPKKKQDDQTHRVQKKEKPKPAQHKDRTQTPPTIPTTNQTSLTTPTVRKLAPAPSTGSTYITPSETALPPIPQSQSQNYTANYCMVALSPTARYDPSIRQLQASYQKKQEQAKIEHQNKVRVQNQQQPQPQAAQQNPRVPQQSKLVAFQQELLLHGEKLNIAMQEILRKKDVLEKQPIDLQKRQLLNQEYKAHLERCREHKIRSIKFQNFQKTLPLEQQQQLQSASKFQAARTPAASQSVARNFPTPTVNRTQSISSAASTAAQSLAGNYVTPIMNRTQFIPSVSSSAAQSLAANYPTPTTDRTQSISSVSSTTAPKRKIYFMEAMTPGDEFVPIPSNRRRREATSYGDRTYLNGLQTKKPKYI